MATQHKEIDAQTLENLLYLSRLSPESTNMETLKKHLSLDNGVNMQELPAHFLAPPKSP